VITWPTKRLPGAKDRVGRMAGSAWPLPPSWSAITELGTACQASIRACGRRGWAGVARRVGIGVSSAFL
jgi:hypothetical protein